MKSPCVRDLTDGQLVATMFLVREKEIRISARSGKSWLELSLGGLLGLSIVRSRARRKR